MRFFASRYFTLLLVAIHAKLSDFKQKTNNVNILKDVQK